MVIDDPRQYQWVLFQKNLFEKHPVRNSTAGTIKTVSSFTRKDVVDYYNKYYVPNNMIISVVGNAEKVKEKISRYFGKLKAKKVIKRKYVKEPLQKKAKKFTEKRKILNSYMVLGYKTVPRNHEDSYVLDAINGILGRGQSGWMFDEIRNKHGLAYQVGVHLEHETDYGYFAVFTGLDKRNIGKANKIILQQFRKLQKINNKDLGEAKTYLEGNYTLNMEDNFHASDNIAYWESIKDVSLARDYIENIKKVKVNDVKRVAKKYLNNKYTLVAIQQK